ncbi:autophagy-related 8i [Olea europaea subsp. europaea]|uniref:Autophagy-related protein n=1 Tax=Olea europaea subsp. europaea TaxID=158383 RepID=A0A8S0VG19_OLEEU|nr:autophagy-related 8i [Olea europaea subsp. europaea]
MGGAKTQPFKEQFSFEERLEESKEIIGKYPDRVPVVVERYSKTDLPEMEKKKYLVPRDMSVGQFIYILSGRLHLAPGKALFVFVNNTLPQTFWWRLCTIHLRTKMGSFTCVTAVRKPLVMLNRLI